MTTPKPPRHALRRLKKHEVRAGKLFLQREIALRTSLTIAQATEAMDAFGDLAWEVLLSGYRLRLGRAGHVGLVVRRNHVFMGGGVIYPQIVLTGRTTKNFRRAWEAIHFDEWAEAAEEDGYEVVDRRR